jgi:hypothetical protein
MEERGANNQEPTKVDDRLLSLAFCLLAYLPACLPMMMEKSRKCRAVCCQRATIRQTMMSSYYYCAARERASENEAWPTETSER